MINAERDSFEYTDTYKLQCCRDSSFEEGIQEFIITDGSFAEISNGYLCGDKSIIQYKARHGKP